MTILIGLKPPQDTGNPSVLLKETNDPTLRLLQNLDLKGMEKNLTNTLDQHPEALIQGLGKSGEK